MNEPEDPRALVFVGLATVQFERKQDVAFYLERRHEVVRLERESDATTTKERERRVIQIGDIRAAEPYPARTRGIETSEHVHERRLTRTARAHDRGESTAVDSECEV